MQRRVLAEEVKPPSTTDHFHERHALSPKITPSAAKPPFFAPIIKRPTARERFPISPRSQLFRKRFFPEASALDWSDWRWQVRSRVKDLAGLARIINLSDDEAAAIGRHTGSLPVGITPYYLTLFDRDDSSQPIRRTHVPVNDEYLRLPGEADDPLGEDHDAAVPGLVHRYPDRVLFLVTGFCSTYCRYCTRSRMVGEAGGEYQFSVPQWERAIDYIEAHPEIRDVLLSGGDPLTLADEKLEWLLSRLRAIRHVEFLRIGTKVPVVLPQRVTRSLTAMLRRYHPLWMSLHFTHPDELTAGGEGGLRPAGRRRHPPGLPDRAAEGHQRRRRDDEAADARPADGAGAALLPLPVRSRSPARPISAPRWRRGWRSSAACAAIPPATPCRPTSSTAPAAAARSRSCPTTSSGATATTCCSPIAKAAATATPIRAERSGWARRQRTTTRPSIGGYPMRVGLTYDLRDHISPRATATRRRPSSTASETIDALEPARWSASASRPTASATVRQLAQRLVAGERWDLVFNIAEGLTGVGREAQVPALLEAYGIPYTFSDTLVMALTLHKGMTKRVVRDCGVPTAPFAVVETMADLAGRRAAVPAVRQAGGRGHRQGRDAGLPRRPARRPCASSAASCSSAIRQPVLVETFLPGREFTVGIIGTGRRPRRWRSWKLC